MAISWINRLLKSKSRPASRRRAPRARLRLEQLEAREVRSVTPVVTAGGVLQISHNDSADTVSIDHVVINNEGFTSVNGTFLFKDGSFTHGIHIDGGLDELDILATSAPVTFDGGNVVKVGKAGNMQGIQAALNLGPDNAVTLDDSADPNGQWVTMNATGGVVTVSGLANAPIHFDESGYADTVNLFNVTIKGGRGDNTFNILDTTSYWTPFFSNQTGTDIYTGSGQHNTVYLQGSSSEAVNIHTGSGDAQVYLGANGDLSRINSYVNLNGDAGDTGYVGLWVDASNATNSQHVTMQAACGGFEIEGMLPSSLPIWYNPEHTYYVDVKGSNYGDTFTVKDTFSNGQTSDTTQIDTGYGTNQVDVNGSHGQVLLYGHGGYDTVNIGDDSVGLQNVQSNFSINNPGGSTVLNINDAADPWYNRWVLSSYQTFGMIERPGMGRPISYDPRDISQVNINGGTGSNRFEIYSDDAPLTINGNGYDEFIVGNFSSSLDDIRGPLTLNGSGWDALIVNDQGSTNGHWYTDTGWQFLRDFGAVTINYSGMMITEFNESTLPIHFGPDWGFASMTYSGSSGSQLNSWWGQPAQGYMGDASQPTQSTSYMDDTSGLDAYYQQWGQGDYSW
jgi:hypothetical protein